MPPKKGASAYFLFCNEQRETAKAKYLSEAGTDKVNVAAIAKLLGQQWRELTDEQRKEYQAKAAEQNATAAAAAAAAESAQDEAQPMEGFESQENQGEQDGNKDAKMEVLYPYGFPLTTVKRIVNMDEEVKSISSDALKATSKAAEMIVQALAREAFRIALAKKQKTIKFSSVLQAVAKDRRWEAAGLKDLLESDEMFEEARKGTGAKSKAEEEYDPQVQQITSFFKA